MSGQHRSRNIKSKQSHPLHKNKIFIAFALALKDGYERPQENTW
jgi:hypothetical protein